MQKFGYLNSSSSTTTDSLYHEEAIIAAIKNMQKYGALNQTGVLDSATIKVRAKCSFDFLYAIITQICAIDLF